MINREMRKVLERNLPGSALEFLTEEFTKLEECLMKIKQMEEKELILLEQIAAKDEMIFQLLEQYAMMSQGGMEGLIGREFTSPSIGFEARRGSPRSRRGRSRTRSALPMYPYEPYPDLPYFDEFDEFGEEEEFFENPDSRRGGTSSRRGARNRRGTYSQGQGGGGGQGQGGGGQSGGGSSASFDHVVIKGFSPDIR